MGAQLEMLVVLPGLSESEMVTPHKLLASLFHLRYDLSRVCMPETPVADMLVHSPPIPLIITIAHSELSPWRIERNSPRTQTS